MLICAIDTSGREGSIALAEGGANSFEVLQFSPLSGKVYSEQLIPTISSALATAGRPKSDIELLVVASGPGSFTGLRVGLGTGKAMSEALHVPIVAISVLEAIAWASGRSGTLLTALDAQRGEVYVGEYDVAADGAPPVPLQEALVTASDFITWLSARKPVLLTYTADETVARRLQEAGMAAELVVRPSADLYARLGLSKFLAGQTVGADVLDANYIRRTDAEILSSPKLPTVPK